MWRDPQNFIFKSTFRGINHNSKFDTNLQDKKNSRDLSGITSPCDRELNSKKLKENQIFQNNCINTNNDTKTIINHIQTTSGEIGKLHEFNNLQLKEINNVSSNNFSNKINKNNTTNQIKINGNMNQDIAYNQQHNYSGTNLSNNNKDSNIKITYNSNSINISGYNSKENLIKNNYVMKSNNMNNDNSNSHTNENLNIAKGNLNINLNNTNSNVKDISNTTKKNNLQNSKIMKSALNYNSTPKTDLIKISKVDKFDNPGKVMRLEKPDSLKYSKDKKEISNYNKIVVFSNNHNTKNLKDRVFLTKQPTNKNSRKTSTEKNAEKIIASYTNTIQVGSKVFGKNFLLNGNNEKNCTNFNNKQQ